MIASLTTEEIKRLAVDIRSGAVFTNRHVREAEDVQMIFMALTLADDALIDRLRADPPGLIYEYMHKASPQAINGYPIFFSAKMLNKADTDALFDLLRRMQEAEDAVLTGAPAAVTVADDE